MVAVSPAVFFAVLCFFAVCLVLLGIGIVIGLVLVAGVTALLALGILSSSALAALLRRRFSTGLRALHYQICAAATLPGGIALLWCGSRVFALHPGPLYVILVGAAAGITAGLLLATILDRFGRFAYRRLLLALKPSTSTNHNV